MLQVEFWQCQVMYKRISADRWKKTQNKDRKQHQRQQPTETDKGDLFSDRSIFHGSVSIFKLSLTLFLICDITPFESIGTMGYFA